MKKLASLFSAIVLLPAALHAATISGNVTTGEAPGTPVPGAKVVLAIGGGGGGARLDSTTTGETGAYTFTTDSTGTRQILVSAEGYVSGSAFVNIASDTGTYTANITINPPLPPGSIAGKVSKASDSSALQGARVILSRFGGGGGGGFTPDTAVTDAEGAYAFDSIPVNSGYSLAVSLDGYQNMTRGSVRVASDSV